MKSLLIVEDEKAIRAGLRAMVANAPVVVENIIECRNGAEAMDILQNQAVDVMITDIRMPKMDGIELIRRAGELQSPPIIVVISGFSEFDYAVDVLRQGVRDYLLKPIERERVYELLATLNAELDAKSRERGNKLAMNSHMLRSIMLGVETGPDDFKAISELCGDFFCGNYVAVCMASSSLPETGSFYRFDDIEGKTVLLVPETYISELKSTYLKGRCAGISGAKNGLNLLREAYIESLQARKRAFMRGDTQDYEEMPDQSTQEKCEAATAEQIVSMLGAGKAAEATGLLGRMLYFAQNDRISAETLLVFLEQMTAGLAHAFAHIPSAMGELKELADVLRFETAYDYYTELCGWIVRLSDILANDLENRNMRSIRIAVEYVGEHFRSQINMAVASNYISMNYTQFSNLFKQYTGSSFSDYLKNLRLAESRRLLGDPSLSVRKVGEMSGFKNEKHFLKCFKQETGVSPSAYRQNLRRESMS